MAVLSGKGGTLIVAGGGVAPITAWRLRRTTRAKTYVANDTGGAVRRAAGAEDSDGSFQCRVVAQGNCPLARGQQAIVALHVDASGENYYEVPILAERITLECDIATGQPLAFCVDFSGDGPVAAHGVVAP